MKRQVCNLRRDCDDGSDEVFCEVGIAPPPDYDLRIAPRVHSEPLKVKLKFQLDRIVHIGKKIFKVQ